MNASQVPGAQETPEREPSRWTLALKEIAGGNAVISILAVFVALVVGGTMPMIPPWYMTAMRSASA